MKKKLCLLILAAVLPLGLSAQKSYPGALEYGGGYSAGVFKVAGEEKNALCSADGGNIHFRYTHYLRGDLGLYGEIGSVLVYSHDYQYFGALNKADGGKYRYRFNNGEYDLCYAPLLTLGGAYRIRYDAFNLVFRAGLGYGERNNNYGYERQSRDGSTGPEYFSFETAGKSDTKDYLLDDGYSTTFYYAPALVVSASAQFVWNTRGRLFFFGEAGFDFSPSKYGETKEYMGSKKQYAPINWVEAVSYADMKDAWTSDFSSTKTTSSRVGMGSHLNLSFGVGINLWKANR